MANFCANVSIIIRTLNEERYLPECLTSIKQQEFSGQYEIIVVDSGSKDKTLSIAQEADCKLLHISKENFTFGRALNIGIEAAQYDIVISLSAHCVPQAEDWLSLMVAPIAEGFADMVYGAHVSDPKARSSEFNYFHDRYNDMGGMKREPRMNNGNSAFKRSIWLLHPFDEIIFAQEDVEFSSWHMSNHSSLFYEPRARVVHYHNDKNKILFRRLYRESKAELMLGELTYKKVFIRIVLLPVKVIKDIRLALKRKVVFRAFPGILLFRLVEGMAYIFALKPAKKKTNVSK